MRESEYRIHVKGHRETNPDQMDAPLVQNDTINAKPNLIVRCCAVAPLKASTVR